MSWFLTRSRAQTDDHLIEEQTLLEGTVQEVEPQPPDPTLILLAMDARGPACRRIHCFEDADMAKRFVKFWYPYRADDSVLGFWMLAAEPLPTNQAEWRIEVLIMVRDSRPGVVYAFTRPDMNSAREFISNEVDYGLDLADVLLFWVVPVEIENDFRGDTVLFPHSLPQGVTASNPSVTALDERDMATALALRKG